MTGSVRITIPIDAVDEADARESVLWTLAKFLSRHTKTSSRQSIVEWMEKYGTVEWLPEESAK